MRIARLDTAAASSEPGLRDYRDLTDVHLRRLLEPAGGLYLAEGVKVLGRALAAGHRPRSALVLEKKLPELEPLLAEHDVPVYVGDEELLRAVTGFDVHRGVLAAMHRPELPSLDAVLAGARRVVVLEDIVDHTNVGAIFRAVAGLGADAVLVSPSCADPLYRRSVRVSMAAVLEIPWTRVEPWPAGLDAVRERGFAIAALALEDGAVPLEEFAADPPERIALLLGTEGDGLRRRTLARADTTVRIPMDRGIDSLNVASAAAVALWALRRRP
ncbi:MAG: RNA methyltransferase [Actinomycetales bacterium]|nr:RNA methyltransferase [Actinomycetales bacterium]